MSSGIGSMGYVAGSMELQLARLSHAAYCLLHTARLRPEAAA
jgi:hypothetical protein